MRITPIPQNNGNWVCVFVSALGVAGGLRAALRVGFAMGFVSGQEGRSRGNLPKRMGQGMGGIYGRGQHARRTGGLRRHRQGR